MKDSTQPVNHFFRENYSRTLNFKKHYDEQAAFVISRSNNISLSDALSFVKDTVNNDILTMKKNPVVNFIARNDVGDRIKAAGNFEEYLQYVAKGGKLLSPTMVVIKSHEEREGIRPKIVKRRIARRGAEKKAKFKYKELGDTIRMAISDNNQNNIKRSLNASSGAALSPHNILADASTHPILTSNCRMAASTANSLNERFIEGNRPYYSADNVIDDLSHCCCQMDADEVSFAVKRFNLYIPTVDDIMEMIHYSADLYWDSEVYMNRIEKFVRGLNDVERCMVMYHSDLYQLRKYNDKVVRDLFQCVIERDIGDYDYDVSTFKVTDDAIFLLDRATMAEELVNKGTINEIKEKYPEIYKRLMYTYSAIDNVMLDYIPIIRAFWANRVSPIDVGSFPSSYRRIGLLSDTDSTVFTGQGYVNWYYNNQPWKYGPDVWTIASIITYFVSSITMHLLAQLMTNYGVSEDYKYEYIMKSEYLFGALGLTGRGKTYYSNILQQEGVIPKGGYDWDIKGSSLIASKVATEITEASEELMKSTIRKLMNNVDISGEEVIKMVYDLELEIKSSILKGEVKYVKVEQIKDKADYTTPNPHQYFHYVFWEGVYATTHGHIDNLPFSGVRLPLTTTTKGRLNTWIESIENPVIKNNIIKILKENNKSNLTAIVLPINNISSVGIPVELLDIIDTDSLISTLMTCFYIILDSFGFLLAKTDNKKSLRLLKDKLAQPFNPDNIKYVS